MKEKMIKALIRALYTIGEVIIASIPTTAATLGDVDWITVASTSLLAGLISFIKSMLVGMPEAEVIEENTNDVEKGED
ncbi:MAG: hypothetical protein J6T15_03685 [Bacilli bacterium]|nr:hypothetical protein [Bacilli bacterium]